MKIIFFYAFIIGSVAAVAPHDRKERRDNSDTPHLRATKGSASGHATATGLFEGELESDVSDAILSVEEIELALEGLDDAQREIELSAYFDFTQNNMSMEEISEKYLSRDTNLGFIKKYKCCKSRNPLKCGWGTACVSLCHFPEGYGLQNKCCAPWDRGTKTFAWEKCQ